MEYHPATATDRRQGARYLSDPHGLVRVIRLLGQCLGWRKNTTLEAGIKAWIKPDAHMNFAAFEHGCLLRTKGLSQLYMHVGEALSISG